MASQPRINSSLVIAIRMAKMTRSNAASGPPKPYYSVLNQNKPDKAYTTERAKKTGKANACSGKIFVTVAPDHFGPILAENDSERGMGVLVGETWEDRLECRQWGAHLPHVAGICGQSDYGAQSVALSGGYEDNEDHGEWFLYTGSGGRDLSGNKRTNKTQSFDQKFDKSNEALRVSCKKGYPVRVVRYTVMALYMITSLSHKEKRSAYAPEKGVRYDGVYRIEKCWRKPGIQGYKVCRYLFVRCDNDPAPWTSDENGDRPRSLPTIKELKDATDVTERKAPPSWDYDEEKACWIWKVPPPESRKQTDRIDAGDGTKPRIVRRKTQMMSNPQVNRELMSVIESLQRQTKEMEENAVLEEEMLNKDDENGDKEEDKDNKSEMEVKDVSSEANEDIKGSDETEVIAKPSPKANKKRKVESQDQKQEGLAEARWQ
ncbi:hypothetical protein L1987_77085 [Smallanthus sonchifolius]|uniref:Uncharacterized protein n=1 Tax=Smallanthus sonchifolius TaxID=185202 RepID=A0ACB8Z808_9ASTR|nr:hypothetical protein L1987_77085 [Smallanthus sonchifolius]